MPIITTADAKEHLRIFHDDEDTTIESKIEAAQAHLESLLGYEIEAEFETVPADLKEAVRQLTSHLFENRESTVVGLSVSLLPLGVRDVVRERRNWSFADAE